LASATGESRPADRHYGIVSYNAATLSGLASNKRDVTVPTKIE